MLQGQICMLNSKKHNLAKSLKGKNQEGFTLMEAVIAILILTIALVGTAAAITYALEFGTTARNVGTAKRIISSSFEEIESLRNTKRLDYVQIANVGAVDNSASSNTFTGFSTGMQNISVSPGPDGVNGTADDFTDAGPDLTYGTGDDFTNAALIRSGYQREIVITQLGGDPNIKKIEVTVKYFAAGGRVGNLKGAFYLYNEANIVY